MIVLMQKLGLGFRGGGGCNLLRKLTQEHFSNREKAIIPIMFDHITNFFAF